MDCPYGCGKELRLQSLYLDLDKTSYEDEHPERIADPEYLVNNGEKMDLWYEFEDGDSVGIHMCKKFQEMLDIQYQEISELDNNEDYDGIGSESFFKKHKDEFNKTLFDDYENFGESSTFEKGDLKLINGNIKLFEKYFSCLKSMKCYNHIWPLIEIGYLLNKRGNYKPSLRIFNLILQTNRYEILASLGKAEVSLRIGDDKTAFSTLVDLKAILDKVSKSDRRAFHVRYDGSITAYDYDFIVAKREYLFAIANARWNRLNQATKSIKNCIKILEEYFDSEGLSYFELSDEDLRKKIKEEYMEEHPEEFKTEEQKEHQENVDYGYMIYPHFDLMQNSIILFDELVSLDHGTGKDAEHPFIEARPGFEEDVAELAELREKYSKIKTGWDKRFRADIIGDIVYTNFCPMCRYKLTEQYFEKGKTKISKDEDQISKSCPECGYHYVYNAKTLETTKIRWSEEEEDTLSEEDWKWQEESDEIAEEELFKWAEKGKTFTVDSPPIPIKKPSDDEMVAEIEFGFRKLIKMKLSREKNWEKKYIPMGILEKANRRLEEDSLGEYKKDGITWLDELEIKDYENIFCYHCFFCSEKFGKREKGKRISDSKHRWKECKKENWDLFFYRVFGLNKKIVIGDLERFRLIRNPIGHHRGKTLDNYLNPEQKEDLQRLHLRWMKLISPDEFV